MQWILLFSKMLPSLGFFFRPLTKEDRKHQLVINKLSFPAYLIISFSFVSKISPFPLAHPFYMSRSPPLPSRLRSSLLSRIHILPGIFCIQCKLFSISLGMAARFSLCRHNNFSVFFALHFSSQIHKRGLSSFKIHNKDIKREDWMKIIKKKEWREKRQMD